MKNQKTLDPRFRGDDKLCSLNGLYAIADSNWNPFGDLTTLVQKFLAGGCRLIQLRMKNSTANGIFPIAKKISLLKKETNFTFIINDHVDIAMEVGADGVHVGEHDEKISAIQKRVGNKLIIGYSSHSLKEG